MTTSDEKTIHYRDTLAQKTRCGLQRMSVDSVADWHRVTCEACRQPAEHKRRATDLAYRRGYNAGRKEAPTVKDAALLLCCHVEKEIIEPMRHDFAGEQWFDVLVSRVGEVRQRVRDIREEDDADRREHEG